MSYGFLKESINRMMGLVLSWCSTLSLNQKVISINAMRVDLNIQLKDIVKSIPFYSNSETLNVL